MDADKIKAFFVHHFEKMIFVVVILLAGLLLWQGTKLPNFLDTEQPDRLATEATQVKSDIDINHNEAIIPERNSEFDILMETQKLYTAVEPSAYRLPRTWEGKKEESIVRREDPAIAAPIALRTVPVATAIAVRGSTTDPAAYTLASLEGADELEKIERPEPRSRRRSRGRGGMDMEMGMEMGMEMEMEMMGMEQEMEMDMMGEMAGGSMAGVRRFNAKNDHGKRPTATDDKRNPEPAVGWFIAGTAVVPHKEIYKEFETAFRDAEGYNPRRDTPFYYNLEVQRADVTGKSVDQLTDQDWVDIWNRELYTKLAARRWSGFAPEIVPSDYRDDSLTLWIPPVLLDDYSYFATHPMIPMQSRDELKRAAAAEQQDTEVRDFIFDDDEDDTVLLAPNAAPSAGMGGMDMEMEMMGMDMEMEMGMDSMMMGMGFAMMGRGVEVDPVEYKLIRFYDFVGFPVSPKYGRTYVYRIRYSVNDPNFPFTNTLQPRTSTLAPAVATRVQELMKQASETQSRKKLFEKWSEWSEPSAPTSLPTLEHYYAGAVDRGTINVWQVAGKNVEYTRDPPKAKIVASRYDLETGARIPFQLDITEGSVLSHSAEHADVVDPITLEVKKLPDAEIVSGTTVVDLGGAEPLKITDDLKAPSLMLLWDQEGNLSVTSDVADLEYYRTYSYADERGED